MAFVNRIRIPMQLHSAQFPQEKTAFRRADGTSKTLSVVVRKQYELETDLIPESWHQRLVIALSHDNVRWEGDNLFGGISLDGDYTIEWSDGPLRYPTAKAASKVQVTPFDATNANCQTCDQVSQLSLVDDQATGIYGALQEDTDYTVEAADNDDICCYPAVFSLVSFNSDYLDSASINAATGSLSIHTGTGLTDANGIIIATYRVTCPDGSYDEADVTADINGSVAGCLAPSVLLLGSNTDESLTASWTEAIPGSTYYWEIYAGTSPVGSPLQTGSVTDDTVTVTGLTPDTTYYFQVRTTCVSSDSNFIGDEFTTSFESENCGSYDITYSSGTPGTYAFIAFERCTGGTGNLFIPYGETRTICQLQTGPGSPVSFTSSQTVTITYNGLC